MLTRIKNWARTIKRDIAALWLAVRDPRTPVLAKYLAAAIVAYALSPIDLIPDFIPVLGLLDDVIIIPLGILLLLRLMPESLMQELRERAARMEKLPASLAGFIAVVFIWLIALAATAWWLLRT